MAEPYAAEDSGPVCASCPVCLLLAAVAAQRPEVAGHLHAAARELTRALTVLADELASAPSSDAAGQPTAGGEPPAERPHGT